jgi:hypothetical protein
LIAVVTLVQFFRVISLAPELDQLPAGPVNDLLGTLPAFAFAWGGWRVVRTGTGGIGAAALVGILLSAIEFVSIDIGWLASGEAPSLSLVALAETFVVYSPVAAALGALGGLVARRIGPNAHAQPALAADGAARCR